MTDQLAKRLEANALRFAGYAGFYDDVRPHPPDELSEILISYCNQPRPDVVDLGSGTGLSSRWAASWAASVTGVEPSDDMRQQAISRQLPNVSYVAGFAEETGLDNGCADIVMAVQSFHWMEPKATIAEVARLLRPGGVFAVIDCDFPPTTGHAALERAWAEIRQRFHVYETRVSSGLPINELTAPIPVDDPAIRRFSERDPHSGQRTLTSGAKGWSKDAHLENMASSGLFDRHHEFASLHRDRGDAERFVRLVQSQSDYQILRNAGLDDETLGIPKLKALAARELGVAQFPFLFTYRVRIGVVAAN